MAKVLIIDDEKMICDLLSRVATHMDIDATYALTLEEGVKEAGSGYDIVFLDVNLPDGSGLEILPEIKKTVSSPEVIIITGAGTSDGAEIAIRNGAWDYLQKPLSAEKIMLSLKRVLQYRQNLAKIKKPIVALKTRGIVGSSSRIRVCLDALAQAADNDANVLLTGETGTGKELFAKAIHFNSARADKNFVVVDCAALPESLIESMLFGHEKGAFTSADKSKTGLIKQADGGTLFLDEVGELPLLLQKTFLRVLQERRFRPIGSSHEVWSDFRLIAATNRDLDQMVKTGQFREDLLYRLRSIGIELPPLRKHPDDIKEIAVHYATRICERYRTETKGFSPDFFDALYAYDWPGNVRELTNALEGAISKAKHEPILFPTHLPDNIRIKKARASVASSGEPPSDPAAIGHNYPSYKNYRKKILADAEKEYFQGLLKITKGSIKETCRISGLGRTRLYMLLKEHDISKSDFS